jgi:hypothetical protein
MNTPDIIDTLSIEFAPVIIPAFKGKPGYWTRYDAVEADNLTSMTVHPRLYGEKLDAESCYTQLDCTFDPEVYSTKKYGIVYGDEQFEENIDLYVRRSLGLMHLRPICYSEAGMQYEETITLDVLSDWHTPLLQLSNHDLMRMIRSKNILRLNFKTFHYLHPDYEALIGIPRPYDPSAHED